MPPLPVLLQVASSPPPPPNYSTQLEAIVKALNRHEAVPSWFLGTLLGFILGLLAEPVKTGIQKFLVQRRTERLLIGEVEMNCLMALLFVSAPRLKKIAFTTDKYDYLQDKERITVFEIDRAGSLARLYRSFEEIATGPAEERKKWITYEFSLFEDAVKNGVMGQRFKHALNKEGSALRKIAAEYIPPT